MLQVIKFIKDVWLPIAHEYSFESSAHVLHSIVYRVMDSSEIFITTDLNEADQ